MPLTSITFTCTSSPAEAREWVGPLVARQPLRLSVIASNIEAIAADRERCTDPRWWAGWDEAGHVVAAFMHTPPHPLHIGYATVQQASALAELLLAQGDPLPGVGGPREQARAFAATWAKRTGLRWHVTLELGVYQLPDRPTLPFPVLGRYRRAAQSDLALTDRWAADFHSAVGAPGRASSTRRHLERGRLGLWVDRVGEPVSMAWASVPSGGVARVSGVWTPPAHRGHGYASAVVAALSDERVDAGERCMLYTDLANPTSNGIYQALGYRRVGDDLQIAFG